MGVLCKDGVILGTEKKMQSKLLVEGTDKRIYNIDQHIGMVMITLVYSDFLLSISLGYWWQNSRWQKYCIKS